MSLKFLRGNISYLSALGAGIIFGVGAATFYYQRRNRLVETLQRLSLCIEELKKDVDELKNTLNASKPSPRRRRKLQEFHSIIDSSGDDDVYEEAFTGGQTDETIEEIATESDNYFSSDGLISPPSFQSVQSHPSSSSFYSVEDDVINKHVKSTESPVPKELYEKVDKLVDGSNKDQEDALQSLLQNRAKYSKDVEYQWRLAKASYLVANIYGAKGDNEKKKELIYSSRDAADAAVKLDDNSSSAHKWYSITVGGVSNYESMQEKIKMGYDIKEHTEKAIKLNPSDPSNHYMLGRWCYSVYMLTWIERKVAATLFATPPTATIDEALNHFLETERLKPDVWKENMLFIGKCYIEKSDYKNASKWLKKAEQLPIKNQDDQGAHDEIAKLLLKYG